MLRHSMDPQGLKSLGDKNNLIYTVPASTIYPGFRGTVIHCW